MSQHLNNYAAAARRKGFSLIELVIVVVIIGIIAAIAIPKMSKGSAGAGDSALKGNLAVMRSAVELYNSEHGALPNGTAANIVSQLTGYTDVNGNTGAKNTSTGITYGPYIKSIPPLPVGSKKGQTTVGIGLSTDTMPSGTTAWLYCTDTGEFKANLAATETPADSTTPYNQF
jgi:prepilin-type N-terminal cleavage/methylation domain-containing protein